MSRQRILYSPRCASLWGHMWDFRFVADSCLDVRACCSSRMGPRQSGTMHSKRAGITTTLIQTQRNYFGCVTLSFGVLSLPLKPLLARGPAVRNLCHTAAEALHPFVSFAAMAADADYSFSASEGSDVEFYSDGDFSDVRYRSPRATCVTCVTNACSARRCPPSKPRRRRRPPKANGQC